jgi:hypothetical protein
MEARMTPSHAHPGTPAPRALLRLALLLFLAVLASACGRTASESDGGRNGAGGTPYREHPDPAAEARAAQKVLRARDTPLEVGAQAPAIPGLEAGVKRFVVFYRGHW